MLLLQGDEFFIDIGSLPFLLFGIIIATTASGIRADSKFQIKGCYGMSEGVRHLIHTDVFAPGKVFGVVRAAGVAASYGQQIL